MGKRPRSRAIGTRAALATYSAGLLVMLVVGAPFWAFRMLISGRYRAGLPQRLGFVPAALRAAARGHDLLWLHAVSVGEVLAATEVIRELRQARPEMVLALSTTTASGQALAGARFSELSVFYLPLDFGYAVRRFLRVLRPKMVILMESELWPRLLWECGRASVPVVVVNARMSDRSFRRAARFRTVWRPVLALVTRFLAQGAETADRLQQLGVAAERIEVLGNLKFDVRAPSETAVVVMLRRRLPERARVLVCGSTLEGEEQILLDAWLEIRLQIPTAVLVLAPRHPQRFAAVASRVHERGLPLLRASELGVNARPVEAGKVVLLDTIGDLASMYSLAAAAFVGGSLVDAGGHNPLEPAQFGVPVLMGPSSYNFREIVNAMQAVNGICNVERDRLAEVLAQVLAGGEAVRAMGERGRQVFRARSGATARTVQSLLALLPRETRAP